MDNARSTPWPAMRRAGMALVGGASRVALPRVDALGEAMVDEDADRVNGHEIRTMTSARFRVACTTSALRWSEPYAQARACSQVFP